MYRTAVGTATLSMLILASTAKAGQLPADMWADDNKYGGRPSITAGPNGVSVVLPESSIVRAGGGAVTDLAKQLLERYAPGMCSSVFDFQSAHKARRWVSPFCPRPMPCLGAIFTWSAGKPRSPSIIRQVAR
jgi:hypothetical protein